MAFLRHTRLDAKRIRVHGTFHLGQLLYTGKDFAIIDFEGDSSTGFEERRKKRSPLYDLAALLISFRRAATSVHLGGVPGIISAPEQADLHSRWGGFWYRQVSEACIGSYLETIAPAGLLPPDASMPGGVPPKTQTRGLLDVLVLEAALAGVLRNAELGEQSILPELRAIAGIMG
jgi:predicted trehalose synthase